MSTVGEFPVVFLSYDEPWADEFWDDLRGKTPRAVRVHGVRGLDASHKAAAEAARADWFVTVDADTLVDPGFFDEQIPEHLLTPNFRLTWSSRSMVNGLVSGNGCLKLWSRRIVREMRTHEAADPAQLSLDHDVGQVRPGSSMSITMPGCFSRTYPAMTPYHGFRCGFRESVFLGATRREAVRREGPDAAFNRVFGPVQQVWSSLGRHTENGLWVIYGARLGLWYQQHRPDWDARRINDYDWFAQFWAGTVLPRFAPGGSRCRHTGVTWDQDRLAEEVEALGRLIHASAGDLAEFTGPQSALVAGANGAAVLKTGASVDALGWAFLKGRGVKAAPAIARDLFETAAAMGLPAALNNLARMHDLAQIPDADPAEAERLYARAAAAGNPHAPYHLARLLSRAPDRPGVGAERIAALIEQASGRGFAPPDAAAPNPATGAWPRALTLGDLPWIGPGTTAVDAIAPIGPVVVVDRDVEPFDSARAISPDPVLLRSGRTLAFPARNALTGQTARCGLRLCASVEAAATGDRDQDLVVPEFAGTWAPDATPESAFHAGHDLARAEAGGAPEALALMASLGADRPNGRWWMLGAGLGLMPGDATAAEVWIDQAWLLEQPERLAQRIEHHARQLRSTRGIPVWPLAARESRLARRFVADWPALAVWTAFSEGCDALGPDGARLAAAYRRAAAWIWGDAAGRRAPDRVLAEDLADRAG